MILTWKAPVDYNERLLGRYDAKDGSYAKHGSNFDYLALSEGQTYPADMNIPEVFFSAPAKKISSFDSLWLLGGLPLISARMAEFLATHAAADIQLIRPTALYASDVALLDEYFIVNATSTFNAVDMDKSDAERDEAGNVIYFHKIFFSADELDSLHIAREARSHDLLISQTLADGLIRQGFKGDRSLGFYSVNRRYVPY